MFISTGDKIILNARTFTRGTAAHIYSRERDREKDRDRDEEKGREVDKDRDKDKDKDRGAVKDKDKGDNQPLHYLLDKPHQLVAALLKLA